MSDKSAYFVTRSELEPSCRCKFPQLSGKNPKIFYRNNTWDRKVTTYDIVKARRSLPKKLVDWKPNKPREPLVKCVGGPEEP